MATVTTWRDAAVVVAVIGEEKEEEEKLPLCGEEGEVSVTMR